MKIRTRKRTAAEKAQDKAKREDKKDLRKDKKALKKDARDDKKAIRQSGANRKDKRDAIKEINKAKKSKVTDIKDDIKQVRKSLEIILPVKTANVALLRQDLRDIDFFDGNEIRPLTIDDAYEILNRVYQRSIEMAENALTYIQPFAVLAERPTWVSTWNNDALLVRWFGSVNDHNDVSGVFNKMNSVVNRLNDKMVIRLHPQRSKTTSAQNNGTFFEPKTFKVFPWLIESNLDEEKAIGYDYMASVFIHELIHLFVFDQKLDGETVYGEQLALKLAEDEPKKARKSPENFEHFCLEVPANM